eukprot:903533-Prorocentrum_minimum.AAC.2
MLTKQHYYILTISTTCRLFSSCSDGSLYQLSSSSATPEARSSPTMHNNDSYISNASYSLRDGISRTPSSSAHVPSATGRGPVAPEGIEGSNDGADKGVAADKCTALKCHCCCTRFDWCMVASAGVSSLGCRAVLMTRGGYNNLVIVTTTHHLTFISQEYYSLFSFRMNGPTIYGGNSESRLFVASSQADDQTFPEDDEDANYCGVILTPRSPPIEVAYTCMRSGVGPFYYFDFFAFFFFGCSSDLYDLPDLLSDTNVTTPSTTANCELPSSFRWNVSLRVPGSTPEGTSPATASSTRLRSLLAFSRPSGAYVRMADQSVAQEARECSHGGPIRCRKRGGLGLLYFIPEVHPPKIDNCSFGGSLGAVCLNRAVHLLVPARARLGHMASVKNRQENRILSRDEMA